MLKKQHAGTWEQGCLYLRVSGIHLSKESVNLRGKGLYTEVHGKE